MPIMFKHVYCLKYTPIVKWIGQIASHAQCHRQTIHNAKTQISSISTLLLLQCCQVLECSANISDNDFKSIYFKKNCMITYIN